MNTYPDAFAEALARIGGISTLDSPTSRRLLAQMDDEAEARAIACEFLAEQFKAAINGDLDAPCVIGPKWVKANGRLPNAADLLNDALDNKDFLDRAVRLLVAAAKDNADAARLLDDVAKHWADQRADDFV